MDARRLLCLGAAEGMRATPMGFEGRGVEAAEAAWQKAKRGELTASEVNSREFKPEVGRLLLVDVSTFFLMKKETCSRVTARHV